MCGFCFPNHWLIGMQDSIAMPQWMWKVRPRKAVTQWERYQIHCSHADDGGVKKVNLINSTKKNANQKLNNNYQELKETVAAADNILPTSVSYSWTARICQRINFNGGLWARISKFRGNKRNLSLIVWLYMNRISLKGSWFQSPTVCLNDLTANFIQLTSDETW
jgi:hypothetical protein